LHLLRDSKRWGEIWVIHTHILSRLLRDETGATAIEYGLIAALIAVAAVVVMGQVGTNLSSTFQTIASNL
jgi:pilus assembly protein Flp/PilA